MPDENTGREKLHKDAERSLARDALNDYEGNDLEKALMDTFPASDPVALASPTKPGRPNHKRKADEDKPPRSGAPRQAK